jgi:hypothetical protein
VFTCDASEASFCRYSGPALHDLERISSKKDAVILGLFLFATLRVGEFCDKFSPFISISTDLHRVLTQVGGYVKDVEAISKEKRRPARGGTPNPDL